MTAQLDKRMFSHLGAFVNSHVSVSSPKQPADTLNTVTYRGGESIPPQPRSKEQNTILVAVACIKGGVGKTTTAMSIAACLARRGEKVTVLDADNTGGATLWEEYVHEEDDRRRVEDEANGVAHKPYKLNFDVVQTNEAVLARPDRIRERYQGWVIIDTPPSDAGTVQTALQSADVSIIPCTPSVSDLSHAGKTYAAARNGIVLVTMVKSNTKLYRAAIQQLDDLHITRFENVIYQREAIKSLYGTNQFKTDYVDVTQELIEYLGQIN